MTDPTPTPWPIDPEHGRVTGPGFLGDSFHSLRVRELFRYYQPPTPEEFRHVAPINTGNDFIKETGLISAVDPILAAFANLTTRVMDMRRCVVSMTGAGTSYVIAESTRSLSLTYPHTHGPGDALMLGGGVATSSLGGLCEHTCSLLPPPVESDEPFLLEIPDLSRHPKFHNVGYVRNWPHARFYCGAPLRTKNGVTIGTVCVLDDRARYNGLTEKERLTMSTMADLFMDYFETKEGSRFRKKGQMMEMELSRFIAEGFLPSDGGEMVERRNGRVWSESILNSKRQGEKERRKKVLAKRQMLQEMEYAKMLKEEEQNSHSSGSSNSGCALPGGETGGDMVPISTIIDTSTLDSTGPGASGSASSAAIPDTHPDAGGPRDEQRPFEEYVPIVHPLQPGIIEMVPASAAEERASLLTTLGTTLPGPARGPKEGGMVEGLADAVKTSRFAEGLWSREPEARSSPGGRFEDAISPFTGAKSDLASPLAEHNPETDTSSTGPSIPQTHDTSSEMLSTTAATSTELADNRRKRSKYEETATMEPHLRAMFARASTVIKNTIDCDVVFVHGDLEGFFEPDFAEGDPHASDEWAWSHVSTDNKSESKQRAKRPKQHRQRSGVLGYATSKGSSTARFDGPKNITDLGFDMSELREEHLSFLLKDSKGGKIFSFFDEYPGLEEHEDPEEVECKRMLRKFLPGCRSVIIVPLHDHNQVLSSVCFAWTCSDQKTFYGDEEGRFATGVATSLMDEMARMHILSADKAKSEFISSISHELRSPLHGILASAEFLIEGDLRPHQRSFVETIMSCGTTLLDTVNHVLDFQKLNFLRDENIKRIEAPSSPDGDFQNSSEDQSQTPKSTGSAGSVNREDNLFDSRFVDIDLSTIVQEVTEGVVLGYEFKDLSKFIGQSEDAKKAALDAPTKVSNIQVIVDIDDLEGGWVFRSNPAAVKRIVGNIVGNAIKYSHDSGWIKITLAAKKLDPTPGGLPRAKVSFIVSDSGKGMSREFLKTRLFTPFTQENPMAAGAGLGLSIVRQLVDMLDGKIDVKSRLGKGTTFRIEMKLTQATPKNSTQPAPQEDIAISSLSGKKALLLGFERFDTYETTEQRGESLLYESVTRYVRDMLKMDLVLDPEAQDAEDCQLIIVNEMRAARMLHDLAILKDRAVILLCNSTPRRSLLDKVEFDRDPGLVTFLRKPCGPKKLMRAAQVCLDILENGLSTRLDAVAASPDPSLSEAANLSSPHTNSRAADTAEFTSLAVRPLVSPRNSSNSPRKAMGQSDDASPVQTRKSDGHPLLPEPGSASTTIPPTALPPATIHAELHASLDKPAVASTSATVSISTVVDTPPQQPRILCVEDNKINMMLVTTYLKKKFYPFETACDGAEALERVKEFAPKGGFDCILMDIQMPIMSGIESTREIRALESQYPDLYKRTFIIALTGLAAGSDRSEAFDAGVDAFMVKPVSFRDLEKMLQQHVRRASQTPGRSGSVVGSSIVSVESERGKNIEIKQQVLAEAVEVGVEGRRGSLV